MSEEQALSLRTKMLGAMVREARLSAGKSIRESAELIGTSSSTFSSYEHGRKGISLPELEVLAFAYRVPLKTFWSPQSSGSEEEKEVDTEQEIKLRQRLLGAQLRKQRQAADLTIKALAERVDFPTSRISDYERGQRPIPLPELEVLTGALGHQLEEYVELDGPIGNWIRERRLFDDFRQLSAELQRFVTDPKNRAYLRLARDLSALPKEELQSVRRSFDEIIP